MAKAVIGKMRRASSAGGRRRNPRGQGERLREQIVATANALLIESGDPRKLTLRGVAKRIGIAATSVYLHFPTIEHLAIAVAEDRLAELEARQLALEAQLSDPAQILLARCRAYCSFAMEYPAHYRVMFMEDLGSTMTFGFEQAPGKSAFDSLVAAIVRCQRAGLVPSNKDAFRLATLVWSAEHGLVALRLTKRRFPWPPLDGLIDDAVRSIIGLSDEE